MARRRSEGGGLRKQQTKGKGRLDTGYSPTAAFRRLTPQIKNTVNTMLKAQAMMFAMFAIDPFAPTKGIPQVGLTPTGAVAGFAETDSKTMTEESLC